MCFFKKKKMGEKTKEDRELIEANSKSIEALIILAKDNDELIKQFKQLRETVKFLIASDKSKVLDYDSKIKNLIGDLRIALTKSDGEGSKKIDDLIVELKLAIADRNTKL